MPQDDRPPEARPLQPREENPQRVLRPEQIDPIHPDLKAAITDFFRTKTFNGYPIDFEGNNIRVTGVQMQRRELKSTPPTSATPPHVPISPSSLSTQLSTLPLPQIRTAEPARNIQGLAVGETNPATGRRVDAIVSRVADPTIHGKPILPLLVKRGDNSKKGIAYVDISAVFQLDGVPDKTTYYKSGDEGAKFSFRCSDASVGSSAAVLILDGLVGSFSDYDLPSGMGGDNYVLPVSNGDEIWVGLTYDTETFEITSRYLNHGSSTPDSTFGTANIRIAGVAVTYEANGNASASPTNFICGDLIFTFDSAALNGRPAIKLTPFSDWIEIELDPP